MGGGGDVVGVCRVIFEIAFSLPYCYYYYLNHTKEVVAVAAAASL